MRSQSLFAVALITACHGATAPRPPPVASAHSVSRAESVTAPRPAVAERPTVVAHVQQPNALLVLGDTLLTSDTSRDAFVRIPMAGGTPSSDVRGAGHYPARLLADGDDAWVLIGSGDTVTHVTSAGMHTPLLSSQPVYAIARDASHVYALSANAPNLRRVPRVDARGAPISPDRSRDLVETVVHVPGAVDLAAIDGDVYLATITAVVHVRPGSAPRRLAALPSRPTVVTVDARDVFAATEDGAVLRVPRAGGEAVELGRIEGRVASLRVDGCLVYAGGARGVVAFERSRGARVPVASGGAATAVTTAGGRVWYTDYEAGVVRAVPLPACPSSDAPGGAREVVERAAQPAPQALPDDDPLAGRSSASEHTVVVRFGTASDPVGREAASRHVTRVLASTHGELWARVSDAQVRALQEQGFDVALRDGADRLRCADVRSSPERARRAPPPPWHAPRAPRAWRVQLAAPSHAFDALATRLAVEQATLLESDSPATLLVDATPAVANRLPARVLGVTLVVAYGAHERLQTLASVITNAVTDGASAEACGPDPDAPLRGLAAWIQASPAEMTELTLLLFRASPAVERAVTVAGGAVTSGAGGTELAVRVPRRALAALGDTDDVRTIEPAARPALDDMTPR